MRQHNVAEGRKCWQTARERERLRARFLIRDRVASEASTSTTTTTSSTTTIKLSEPTSSSSSQRINHNDDDTSSHLETGTSNDDSSSNVSIVLQNIQYIQNGDRSKFSLALLSKQCKLLSSVITTRYLHEKSSSSSFPPFPQALDLCIAWFGRNYSTFLQEYVTSLSGFTIMEYTIWLGKYSILGSLLVGGINPCIRSQHDNDDQHGKYDDDDDKIQHSLHQQCHNHPTIEWQEQLRVVGTHVLKRFFDSFPLPLSSYIVKRVVDMRMDAYLTWKTWKSKEIHHPDTATQPPTTPTNKNVIITSCRLCGESSVPLSVRLCFSPCGHTFCEPCFWKDLLCHIDNRGELEDVIVCPVCDKPGTVPLLIDKYRTDTPSDHQHDPTAIHLGSTQQQQQQQQELSPTQRRLKSLEKFLQLPVDRQALKNRREKRKKLSERHHLISSWYGAVEPSLGSTQDVRRDKFFVNVDRNAIHYVRGCLMAGVDVNWTNEYGQTALYMATWRGHNELMELLLQYGADPWISANGGSTVQRLCESKPQPDGSLCLALLNRYTESSMMEQGDEYGKMELIHPLAYNLVGNEEEEGMGSPLLYTTLIEEERDHPGAGSYLMDHTLSSHMIDSVLQLWKNLPKDTSHNKKKKSSIPCSVRSYYCDAEGYVRQLMTTILERAGLASPSQPTVVFPHMRFLDYAQEGIILAPHVDLCRVDPVSGQRSTHSFLLYLTDCECGGETSLLGDLSGEGRNYILATIAPKRGRLLLFPHACPHEGQQVVDVPKILLRGEVMLSKKRSR